MVKNLPAKAGGAEDAGLTPGLGRSPGEGATHCTMLVGKIPWTRSLEPDGL